MAYASEGVRAMANRVLLLPQMDARGCHRGYYGHPSSPRPQEGGKGGKPQHGDHRLQKREDVSPHGFRQGHRREQENQGTQGTHCG